MDLRESASERDFRLEVRQFVQANLPDDLRQKVLGFLRLEREDYVRWQRILADKGWAAPNWPAQYGGCGWDAVRRTIFEEECYNAGAPRQMPFGINMLGPVLQNFGTQEQCDRFLPAMLTMDDWWCQGYSEPGAGSDLASLTTRAVRSGSGGYPVYVVNGQKTWTSFARWANWMFALVRTSSEGKPREGISMLLIPMDTPGITVRPIKTLDGGHDVNDVFFEDVEVPVANRVGEENAAWAYGKFLLAHERTATAGIGMCKRLLRRAKEIAGKQTRNGKPLLEDRAFRERLAQLEIEVLSHEWTLARLLSREHAGESLGAAPSMLKIRGSEIQGKLSEFLMDCAGPMAVPYQQDALHLGNPAQTAGDRELNPLTGLYLDLRKVAIFAGTNEIQREIISKSATRA